MKKRVRNNLNILLLMILISILIIVSFIATKMTGHVVENTSLAGIKIYVATNGNDNNPGTIESPFKTIEKARLKARELKSQNQPIYVLLRQGTYSLDKALEFSNEDSGTASNPITYMSYPGEKATISGGKQLSLQWQKYNNNVYMANVGSVRFNSAFINDKRCIRAREPDVGYFVKGGGSNDFRPGNYGTNLKNVNLMEVISFCGWHSRRGMVTSASGNSYTVNNYCSNSWMSGRFFIENFFEGLDSEGECYLDSTNGNFYYYPRNGENITTAEVIYPTINVLFNANGVSYLNFKNLIFSHSDWIQYFAQEQSYRNLGSVINFKNSNNCEISGNTIKHLGLHAIHAEYSKYINLSLNDIFDIGGGGTMIGIENVNSNDGSEYITISDNKVHDVSKVYHGSSGILIKNCANNLVSHNDVYNVSYSGISVGWRWDNVDVGMKNNIIEYNEIFDVMQEMHDGGAIYTLGKQPGTQIRNNLIHDVQDVQKINHLQNTQIKGIYLDQGTTPFIVKNNIVYRCTWEVDLHEVLGGGSNIFENNIFVDASNTFVNSCSSGDVFRRNIFYQKKYSASPSTTCGASNNLAGEDPLFVDYANDNFNLLPNSPAFSKIGFQAINMSTVGPRYTPGF
jgi:hypothetical protein